MFFILLHCKEDSKTMSPSNEDRLVSCSYTGPTRIYGNPDCTLMFCNIRGECSLKDNSIEKTTLLCSAIKDSNGNISCPKAYECAIDEALGYDTTINEKKGDITSHSLNYECPGSVDPLSS